MSKTRINILYRIILMVLALALTVLSFLPLIKIHVSVVIDDLRETASDCSKPLELAYQADLLEYHLVNEGLSDTSGLGILSASNLMIQKTYHDSFWVDNTANNAVKLYLSISGLFTTINEEPDGDIFGSEQATYVGAVLGQFLFIALAVTAAIFAIRLLIKFIVLLVSFIKSFDHFVEDAKQEKAFKAEKFPFTGYAVTMLSLYCAMRFFLPSNAYSMGVAIFGSLVIAVLVSILRAVRTILLVEEEDRMHLAVQKGIKLVAIAALIVLLVTFVGAETFAVLGEKSYALSETYYNALFEDGSVFHDHFKLESKTESNILRITVLMLLLGVTVAVLTAIALRNKIKKLGNQSRKPKWSEKARAIAAIVLAVVIAVIAFVPVYLSVDSAEELEEAYSEGNFRIWYGEYKQEGTELNETYQSAKETISIQRGYLKAAKSNKNDFTEYGIYTAKQKIASAERQIRQIEHRANYPTLCAVFAVIFLLSEIAYAVVPSYLDKRKKTQPSDDGAQIEPIAVPQSTEKTPENSKPIV